MHRDLLPCCQTLPPARGKQMKLRLLRHSATRTMPFNCLKHRYANCLSTNPALERHSAQGSALQPCTYVAEIICITRAKHNIMQIYCKSVEETEKSCQLR